MFYADNKYIGARKPFDYPEDIHFNNKKLRKDAQAEIDYKAYHSDADFSEMQYVDSSVYNSANDFGGFPEFFKDHWKAIYLAVAVAGLLYWYNKKK